MSIVKNAHFTDLNSRTLIGFVRNIFQARSYLTLVTNRQIDFISQKHFLKLSKIWQY